MAVTPDKVQIGTSQDFLDGVAVDTSAGTGLFRETVVLADPENGGGLANVKQLGTQLTTADKGIVTNTIIHGLTTGGGGGFVDVKVNPSGAMAVDAGGSEVSLDAPTIAALTPQTDALTNAQLRESPVPVTFSSTGTWGYKAGIDGSPSIPANAKITQISASASTSVAGSFTINGGDSVPIPVGQAVTFEPGGLLVSPSIVFTSTASYIVEYRV